MPATRVPAAYRTAGVDIAAADGWLKRMAPVIRATRRPEVLRDRGQFAGLFRLPRGRWREPVLVASTDGVGTKLKVAQLAGRHEGIGIDAVAMNVNDILVYGAEPLFFLDYLAVGTMQPALMSTLLKGVAEGCRQSGCALLGGETAEMPGLYGPGEYDLAGFCVGVVERRRLLDGSQVRAGDRIIGLAASGVHANGFSLIRKIWTASQLRQWASTLLVPTRIYVRPVLQALRRAPIHAIAHVTGGGLARRLPSLVAGRPGLAARLQPKSWPVPPIFAAIQRAGALSPDDMRSTFNMGIGLALVCPSGAEQRLLQHFRRSGIPAWSVGVIERARS